MYVFLSRVALSEAVTSKWYFYNNKYLYGIGNLTLCIWKCHYPKGYKKSETNPTLGRVKLRNILFLFIFIIFVVIIVIVIFVVIFIIIVIIIIIIIIIIMQCLKIAEFRHTFRQGEGGS